MKKNILLFFIVVFQVFTVHITVFGQPLINKTYVDNLKSVQTYAGNDVLQFPVIVLNSSNQIQLSFDLLEDDVRNLQYKVVHCDKNWNPSPLQPTQYLEGYITSNNVSYDYSFSTLVPYIHYKLAFPENNYQPKLSGNYVFWVFESGYEDEPILTSRFLVVEPKVGLSTIIKRSQKTQLRDTLHEVDVTVTLNDFNQTNSFADISLTLLQNFRWENAIQNLKPRFVRDKALIFDYELESSFIAGNEYRYFDTRTLLVKTDRILQLDKEGDTTKAFLYTDVKRSFGSYTTWEDINGQAYLDNALGRDPDTESDYVWVQFSLKSPGDNAGGRLFVNGSWTFDPFDEDYAMDYYPEHGVYAQFILLKQGYYNYQYITSETYNEPPSPVFAEGTYFETENDYQILVYYKDFSGNYDKLIGFSSVKSTDHFFNR